MRINESVVLDSVREMNSANEEFMNARTEVIDKFREFREAVLRYDSDYEHAKKVFEKYGLNFEDTKIEYSEEFESIRDAMESARQ